MMNKLDINTNLSKVTSLANQNPNLKNERLENLKKAAQQFEAIFISHMLKVMRETIPEGGLFERKLANEFYESMFDDEIAMQLAMRQNHGFADLLFRQLSGKLDTGTPIKDILDGVKEIKSQDKSMKSAHPSLNLQPIVQKAAKEFNLDPNLIFSVIQQESGGNPNAISSKGAKGLMQLMDSTANLLGINHSIRSKT